MNVESWFSKNNEKQQINSTIIYKDLLPQINQKISQDVPVDQIVEWIRNEVKAAYFKEFGENPKTGALNNSTGRWNEFIAIGSLRKIAIEINRNNQECIAIFPIENSKVESKRKEQMSSVFLNLFDKSEFSRSHDLEAISKIKHRIFFPSPDFIVAQISDSKLASDIKELLGKQSQDPENRDIYQLVKGKLKASEVKAVISLKTSNRPDRRYQPSFEAAIIKAIGHVTQQDWKYFMVVSDLTPADKKLFKEAVSPHGIALKLDTKLVDALFLYKNKKDLASVIQAALVD